MKLIPTLPQRERTHVTTPSRDTRSSPYARLSRHGPHAALAHVHQDWASCRFLVKIQLPTQVPLDVTWASFVL